MCRAVVRLTKRPVASAIQLRTAAHDVASGEAAANHPLHQMAAQLRDSSAPSHRLVAWGHASVLLIAR